jgi:hypothetical protein
MRPHGTASGKQSSELNNEYHCNGKHKNVHMNTCRSSFSFDGCPLSVDSPSAARELWISRCITSGSSTRSSTRHSSDESWMARSTFSTPDAESPKCSRSPARGHPFPDNPSKQLTSPAYDQNDHGPPALRLRSDVRSARETAISAPSGAHADSLAHSTGPLHDHLFEDHFRHRHSSWGLALLADVCPAVPRGEQAFIEIRSSSQRDLR